MSTEGLPQIEKIGINRGFALCIDDKRWSLCTVKVHSTIIHYLLLIFLFNSKV